MWLCPQFAKKNLVAREIGHYMTILDWFVEAGHSFRSIICL